MNRPVWVPLYFIVFLCIVRGLGRRAEYQLSQRDRCGQKEEFSLFCRLCAVILSSHRRSSAGDVHWLARSRDACVWNPSKTGQTMAYEARPKLEKDLAPAMPSFDLGDSRRKPQACTTSFAACKEQSSSEKQQEHAEK